MGFGMSSNRHMSAKLDFPPVAREIIWMRVIDRKLETYLERVEVVLGRNWESRVEGQYLKRDVESFRAKLNHQCLYEHWKKGLEDEKIAFTSNSCLVLVDEEPRVNFPAKLTTVMKEARNYLYKGKTLKFGSIILLSYSSLCRRSHDAID